MTTKRFDEFGALRQAHIAAIKRQVQNGTFPLDARVASDRVVDGVMRDVRASSPQMFGDSQQPDGVLSVSRYPIDDETARELSIGGAVIPPLRVCPSIFGRDPGDESNHEQPVEYPDGDWHSMREMVDEGDDEGGDGKAVAWLAVFAIVALGVVLACGAL